MNKYISNLVLLASSLQVFESYFPHPIPGVRLGLANFVGLLTIIKFGLPYAMKVTIFRTLCSSLFLGTFLSVSFVLSFVSGIISTVIMWVMYKIFCSDKIFLKLSPLGISIIGAVVHNLSQLYTIYILFVRQIEMFYFLPILLFSAVITGSITGLITSYVLKELRTENFVEELSQTYTRDEKVFISSNFSWEGVKLIFVFMMLIFCTLLFFLDNFKGRVLILICMFAIYTAAKSKYKILLSNLLKIQWLIFISIFVPLAFSQSGRIIFSVGKFVLLTVDNLNLSLTYIFRIIGLTITSSFLIQQFTIEEIGFILSKILFFYPDAGIVLVEVLVRFPEFMEKVKEKFNFKNLFRVTNFRLSICQPIVALIKEIVCS